MYSKRSLILLSISAIVFSLFGGGCGNVTNYGHDPEQIGTNENILEFSIYYNSLATVEDCDVKVKEDAEKFMKENNYSRYSILDRRNVFMPSKYVYKIEFFR